MIKSFILTWPVFQTQYLMGNPIFLYETEERWCFYAYEGPYQVKCFVEKGERIEENIMFVDRYIMSNQNVTRVKDIETDEVKEEEIEEYDEPQLAELDSHGGTDELDE